MSVFRTIGVSRRAYNRIPHLVDYGYEGLVVIQFEIGKPVRSRIGRAIVGHG